MNSPNEYVPRLIKPLLSRWCLLSYHVVSYIFLLFDLLSTYFLSMYFFIWFYSIYHIYFLFYLLRFDLRWCTWWWTPQLFIIIFIQRLTVLQAFLCNFLFFCLDVLLCCFSRTFKISMDLWVIDGVLFIFSLFGLLFALFFTLYKVGTFWIFWCNIRFLQDRNHALHISTCCRLHSERLWHVMFSQQ